MSPARTFQHMLLRTLSLPTLIARRNLIKQQRNRLSTCIESKKLRSEKLLRFFLSLGEWKLKIYISFLAKNIWGKILSHIRIGHYKHNTNIIASEESEPACWYIYSICTRQTIMLLALIVVDSCVLYNENSLCMCDRSNTPSRESTLFFFEITSMIGFSMTMMISFPSRTHIFYGVFCLSRWMSSWEEIEILYYLCIYF